MIFFKGTICDNSKNSFYLHLKARMNPYLIKSITFTGFIFCPFEYFQFNIEAHPASNYGRPQALRDDALDGRWQPVSLS
jgi:hypothetical protein